MQNLVFSRFLKEKSHAKKVAYLGLLTAINVIFNCFLEFKTLDVQFSFTIVVSVITGIFSGAFSGFIVCMLADFIGYLINSFGYVYMPWVGLSTGCLALFSGLIFIKNSDKIVIKTIIICAISLFVCTILINTTGLYFYYKAIGFTTSVLNYVNEYFGKNVSYFTYILYRLIFKGQIINSIFNFVILFVILPVLKRFKIIY